jgi:hypothetical protein
MYGFVLVAQKMTLHAIREELDCGSKGCPIAAQQSGSSNGAGTTSPPTPSKELLCYPHRSTLPASQKIEMSEPEMSRLGERYRQCCYRLKHAENMAHEENVGRRLYEISWMLDEWEKDGDVNNQETNGYKPEECAHLHLLITSLDTAIIRLDEYFQPFPVACAVPSLASSDFL